MHNARQHPLEIHHLSHDLRGPLNSILGFAELLLEGIEGPLNDIQTEDINAIYQSAQNLLLLINNVVDISKLEAGQLNFDFGPVNLGKILRDVSIFEFGSIKPKQLEVIINHNPDLPWLWGDRNYIEQMLLDLLRFAFKIKRSGKITLTPRASAQRVTFQVTIPNITMPTAVLDSLFELIVQVDAAGRSELGQGGLELPLVRRLAEGHQGRVWAEQSDTSGLNLYLELPIHHTAADKTD